MAGITWPQRVKSDKVTSFTLPVTLQWSSFWYFILVAKTLLRQYTKLSNTTCQLTDEITMINISGGITNLGNKNIVFNWFNLVFGLDYIQPQKLNWYIISVQNYCQSVSPKQTSLEEDQELFLKLFFNFMFMIWDSRQQDWQLLWLSFEHGVIIGFDFTKKI